MKWWGMIFMTQFDAKKKEDDGFWSEIEWGMKEEEEQCPFNHESGLPDVFNRKSGYVPARSSSKFG